MPTVRYTSVHGEVLAEKRDGVRRFYVPDPLGSTVALLDSSQTKTDTFTYWPYGEVKDRTGTTATPLQFVGTQGYYRDKINRVYVRARHLRVDHGRWLTEDPMGVWGNELNLYRYVENKPVTGLDPSGLYPKVICPSNPARQTELNNAVKKVCDALQGAKVDGLINSKCLNRPGQELCMVNWCKHTKSAVRCGNLKTCRNLRPGGVCAYSRRSVGAGSPVFICPLAWSISGCKKWPCSSLVGNILHEIASVCGSPHTGGGSLFPDPCDFRADCLCNRISGLK